MIKTFALIIIKEKIGICERGKLMDTDDEVK